MHNVHSASNPPPTPPKSSASTMSQRTRRPHIQIALSNASTYRFTLAVVGSRQTGKSTFIKKAFKKLQVSETAAPVQAINAAGRSFQYFISHAQVAFAAGPTSDSAGITAHITILEIALEDLDITDTQGWPSFLPAIDAIFLIYDCTSVPSYVALAKHLDILANPNSNALALMLASKCDQTAAVDIDLASHQCRQLEVGLVEAEATTKSGRDKMRVLVEWTMKTLRRRSSSSTSPTSPTPFGTFHQPWLPMPAPPLETESESDASVSDSQERESQSNTPTEETTPVSEKPPPLPPKSPLSPSRQKTTPLSSPPIFSPGTPISLDEYFDPQLGKLNELAGRARSNSAFSTGSTRVSYHLDTILHRLFFAAVAGNEPFYIECFFLTYRHFATPRNVLLGIQKFLFQIGTSTPPPHLKAQHTPARFAPPSWLGDFPKMRIFSLLDWWRRTYPGDFASPDAASAFMAVVVAHGLSGSTIIYEPELHKFGLDIPNLTDPERDWAVAGPSKQSPYNQRNEATVMEPILPQEVPTQRKRSNSDKNSGPVKPSLKKMREAAAKLNNFPAKEIAQEITRILLDLFLAVAPRDWISHSVKKRPSLNKFSAIYNHIGFWVTSLILCHETAKLRSKQISKFIEVAQEVRKHHNYAGLRALTAGITNASYEGDKALEIVQESSLKQAHTLLSYQRLFSSSKAHAAYRTAVRGRQEGAIIPELEVHTSDIMRLLDTSVSRAGTDVTDIQWERYSTMGRLALDLVQCQTRCVQSGQLRFLENEELRSLILDTTVMDVEMQYSRLPQVEDSTGGNSMPTVRKWVNLFS